MITSPHTLSLLWALASRSGPALRSIVIGLLLALAITDARASEPTSATVSERTFDEIIAILNERPDTAPELLPAPVAITGRAAALQRCAMAPRQMLLKLYRSKPAPELGPNRSAFDVTETRLPLLLGDAEDGAGSTAPLFVRTDVMAVNLDGSPRAYHPADIWASNCTPPAPPAAGSAAVPPEPSAPKRPCALNVLCYAGVRFFADGSRPVRCSDRAEYERLWQEMWPLIESGRARPVSEELWARDPMRASDGRYGFFHPEKPVTVLFKNTIIPRSSSNGPCMRDVSTGRYKGYFVNKTSLKGSERQDEPEGRRSRAIVTDQRCSPLPYVNAETLPALVIPKGGFAGARVGDLVVAFRREGDGTERWVHAIVGDEGPNDKFGEGSLALNAALRGHAPDRRWDNYRELVRDTHIGERGANKESIGVLIFRGSAASVADDLSRKNVSRAAARLFRRFGDGSIDAAKRRYLACLEALTP